MVQGVNLVAVIATSDRGSDGKYRDRQSDRVIESTRRGRADSEAA